MPSETKLFKTNVLFCWAAHCLRAVINTWRMHLEWFIFCIVSRNQTVFRRIIAIPLALAHVYALSPTKHLTRLVYVTMLQLFLKTTFYPKTLCIKCQVRFLCQLAIDNFTLTILVSEYLVITQTLNGDWLASIRSTEWVSQVIDFSRQERVCCPWMVLSSTRGL